MTTPRTVRVAMCQLNVLVGDLSGNADQIAAAYRRADAAGADLAVFPELAICGYPPEDLLLKPAFLEQIHAAVADLASRLDGRCAAVLGWVEGERHPDADPHDAEDGPWNAAAVLHGGRVVASYRKQALPNYGVFDEKRYFDPGGADQPLVKIAGADVAVTICEDIWLDDGPVRRAADRGAHLVLNLNASPFHRGRQRERHDVIGRRAAESKVPIVYVNLVGGQDELVFDGGSMVVGADGAVVAELQRFVADEAVVDVAVGPAVSTTGDTRSAGAPSTIPPSDAPSPTEAPAGQVVTAELGPLEEVWQALVLGVSDYVDKNGFRDVVVGLSGGVDSAIVAALAVDALGADRVHAVLMPSRYSSDHSVDDAIDLCELAGIEHRTVAIEPAHRALMQMLEPSFAGLDPDLTEENLQSRIRGVVLMALSNKLGWLVLTTGNKSETAVGYSTLYGDTAGGLAVIKDVPKLLVYELCHWRNDRQRERTADVLIPESILTKAPSAELRPDQRDDQSLPSYEVLDPIIEAYVDHDLTVDQIVSAGNDRTVVERITRLVDLAEYKRRQAPPGLRISKKAFGRDRRLPITKRV